MAAAAPGPELAPPPPLSAWQLIVTSATPVLVVCLLASVGVALAKKGVLRPEGCQLLARISFLVFTPALTFTKLSQAVSLDSLGRLYPLLLNMTASILVGLVLGLAASRALRTPPELRVYALTAVAFGNVGQLPLVFVSALCHDRAGLFYRSLGETCETDGVAYTAFNIAIATLWQFTLGINLIRRSAEAAAARGADGQPGTPPSGGAHDGGVQLLRKHPTVSDLLGRPGSGRGVSAPSSQGAPSEPPSPHQVVELSRVAGRPALPLQQSPLGWRGSDGGEDDRDRAALLGSIPAAAGAEAAALGGGSGGGSRFSRALVQARAGWRYFRANWESVFPLPIQAAIVAIVVGCIAPVKALLYGPRPHLRVVSEALDTLSAGLIPVSMPLLGAVLARGPGASRLPLRVTLGVLVTRLIIHPAVLTALAVAGLASGLLRAPDPMFLLSLLLSNATPTAINIQNIAVLFRHGEAEVSTMLFSQYLASILTLPAWTWLFLRIIHAYA